MILASEAILTSEPLRGLLELELASFVNFTTIASGFTLKMGSVRNPSIFMVNNPPYFYDLCRTTRNLKGMRNGSLSFPVKSSKRSVTEHLNEDLFLGYKYTFQISFAFLLLFFFVSFSYHNLHKKPLPVPLRYPRGMKAKTF